jgi:hypothetical protein
VRFVRTVVVARGQALLPIPREPVQDRRGRRA